MARKKAKQKRSNLVSDQLRQAIDDSGVTRYRIAQETGISETALALFYNGQRGLSMKALNALGEFLQLKIISGRKPEQKGK
jgi:transcriptional regulator with XRE-family HTH domain